MRVVSIKGREILDSRGNPTVEVDLVLDNGAMGRASVPSGASTGSLEAAELRDNDKNRYLGRGVLKAVENINNTIANALQNKEISSQDELDSTLCELDGTKNKARLGSNAILAVSLAFARAHAKSQNIPLFVSLNQGEKMCMPVPMMNILNGGVHADNNVDIQEFMVMPIGAKNFPEALQMGVEVFFSLKSTLKSQGFNTSVGDEGGFAPNLTSNKQALDFLSQATEMVGLRLGQDIVFSLDVAASELFSENNYTLKSENKILTADELIAYYADLIEAYPIVSIEDGLDESDWQGWQNMTKSLGEKIQLVGDDLFVTNKEILQQGISSQTANAVLIKLNQIGTLSETRQTMNLARENNYNCVMSHRSGETEDSFIADLAVATGCGQIKTGSLCRTDRIAKYNQLLRINELKVLEYAGKSILR
ncbi:MAG: phosphopyruvate hydratase [Legionellales bacterium RIFCSPHIGHO2_12_FULL_35_11]|nr:MAG: phosphopyruvate hydratase [Legionellales bacterium RIFCSPHIGHO2_12_FULL_35_11]